MPRGYARTGPAPRSGPVLGAGLLDVGRVSGGFLAFPRRAPIGGAVMFRTDAASKRRMRVIAGVAVLLAAGFAFAAPGPAAAQSGGSDVVGGTPTSIEKWPWQVALVAPRQSGGSAYERQRCGGVLVTRLAVVTAAHCVRDGGFQPASRVSVVTGRRVLSSTQGAEIEAADI